MNACISCSKVDARAVCSKCKTVYYCSRECQTSDWKRHKPECQQITKKKYFLKSSFNLSDIKCGYGCFCEKFMADVKPFKVLLSYQSENVKQKEYLVKMLTFACEEIKDIKFEFDVVNRDSNEIDTQIGSCDVLVSDMSPIFSDVSSNPHYDPIVMKESELRQRTSFFVFNYAHCTERLPQCDGGVQFHADENALEQSLPNRPFIRDIQTVLMKHVTAGFQIIAETIADLSPALVFGLIRTVAHPTFDDKKFPFIVFEARLREASIYSAVETSLLVQSTHFRLFGHFPVGITTPHVVFHRSECSEEVSGLSRVCFRLSTQMIKYYWPERAVKDIPPADPMQFYAVISTKKSSGEVVMFDENVLFLFPKAGNEDFEIPGMAGCVRRGDFARVSIF